MNDLISRQDAIDAIKKSWINGTSLCDADKLLCMIKEPSSQEYKSNRLWWVVRMKDKDDFSTYRYACPQCDHEPLYGFDGKPILSNYCPFCGEKLNGE